jgi:Rps23 Pro-64 3,4-dihydroxylase Tpa1-like proline 4-hydroxylase|tara:strand:- start:652 stop:1218 length:567 start_codon:yes stop_codon:yes gene_type:complete
MDVEELKYISIIKDVLPPLNFKRLLKYFDNDMVEEAGKIGHGGEGKIATDIRKVAMHWFRPDSQKMTDVYWYNYLRKIFADNAMNFLKERNIFHSFTDQFEIHLLKYYENNFYNLHSDYAKDAPRELSFSLLLNDDYEGGDFIFLFKNKEYPVTVEKNNLLIFPSNFIYHHRISKVTKGVRKAVVGWI